MKNIQEIRAYKREWMRVYRIELRRGRLLLRGRCPECEMILVPEHEQYHKGCPFYEKNKCEGRNIHIR